MATVVRQQIPTIEFFTKVKVDDQELQDLIKLIENLGITVNTQDLERARKVVQANSLLAIATIQPAVTPADAIKTIVGVVLGLLVDRVIEKVQNDRDKGNEIRKIIETNPNLPTNPVQRQAEAEKILRQKELFFEIASPEEFVRKIVENFEETGIVLKIEDIIAQEPEVLKFFDKELIDKINASAEQQINSIVTNIKKANLSKTVEESIDILGFETEFLKDYEETFNSLSNIQKDFIFLNDETNQSLIDTSGTQSSAAKATQELTERAKEQIGEYEILDGALAMVGDGFIAVTGAESEFQDTTEKTTEKIGQQLDQINNTDASLQGLISQNAEVINSEGQVKKSVEDVGNAMGDTGVKTEELTEETKNASEVLTGLGVFAADVAANINDAFSDLIFNSLKGNFDTLGDLWDNTLDSMLETLSQFLATVISNPIRLSLETFLGGGSGGGGGFFDFGGLGSSFGSLGSLFGIGGGGGASTGVGLGFAGVPFGGSSLLATPGAIGGGAGFFSTLGSAIPAIGAIAAFLGAAIPIISNLFDKSPRLDVDIGVIKSDIEKRGATVEEFLDPSLLDEVVNISVKRKAGLGLGDELPDVIREAIEGEEYQLAA